MKKVHLLCNAHLDPVWLWQRQEGIAEAISTFRVAAKFCEEYDGFIFNHNESLLYEWVEEYEPALFEKIKKLVKEGKWKIMGGWYLQPDCVMPSGESFIRQIEIGRKYFKEKFGVVPTTAINFDPFGHTRGLVQILKKCGYDSYLFMRPNNFVPECDFIWKGYDGSEIVGHCMKSGYNTNKGKVRENLDQDMKTFHDGANLFLWGIGNHGGGPSKVDLKTIEEYKKEHPEVEIIHSWCENYFSEVNKSKLRTVESSVVHCMVGCYTSMVRVKQMHRKLESELGLCEKMLAVSNIAYSNEKMEEVKKSLAFCQFHDILPGSMIKAAEEDSLKLMNYGREIVARYCDKAFFTLCEGQKEGKEGEIPILVFNPHPYCITHDVEVEFQLQNQNWNDCETTIATVRDENGNYIPCQNEKEACTFNLDWRKRVVFRAELKPMSINRFDCELHVVNSWKRPIEACRETQTHFVVATEQMEVHINKFTGLMDKYAVNGKDYLKEDSAKIIVCKDDEDPWGMVASDFCECIGEFSLVSDHEADDFNGYPQEGLKNVRIIENGDVRCKIQAIFRHKKSFAVVTYAIPKKDSYVDINIKMLSNDVNMMYKLEFKTPFENASFEGQTAFGRESMIKDDKEVTFQKWCGLMENNAGIAVLNKGTYGGSADNGIMKLSLMRTPVYSAITLGMGRDIAEHDRCHDHIDMGERQFEYRLTTDMGNLEKNSEIYNQDVYALSFFPSGMGEKKETSFELSNGKIILSAYRNIDDGAKLVRLYNSSDVKQKTLLKTDGVEFEIQMGAYEVKTFTLKNHTLSECNMISL